MIPKKIYKLKPEIKEKVFEKFPVSKAERDNTWCRIEKATMEGLRWREAQRLYDEMGNTQMEFK